MYLLKIMKVTTRKIDCIVQRGIWKTQPSMEQSKEWDKRKVESDTERIAKNHHTIVTKQNTTTTKDERNENFKYPE